MLLSPCGSKAIHGLHFGEVTLERAEVVGDVSGQSGRWSREFRSFEMSNQLL